MPKFTSGQIVFMVIFAMWCSTIVVEKVLDYDLKKTRDKFDAQLRESQDLYLKSIIPNRGE